MKNNIVVIGSANIDMVIKTEKFPQPGETIVGGEFFQSQGGKGANQAVAAARLGGNVNFIARIGNDNFGQQAIRQYKKEGIGVENIKIDSEHHTGVALISVNGEGENKITVAPGANFKFSEQDVNALKEVISEADILLLQLEIPLETIGQVLKLAKQNSTKVILNPAPAQPFPKWYFENLFLISPNKTEAEQLTGISINEHRASIVQAAQKLKSFGVQNIVITLGGKGAYLLTKSYSGLIPVPRVKVNDTTAAGDIFNGALAVALTENKGWEQSAQFACTAAAVSVAKNGAQNSAPTKEEVSLFSRNGEKIINS